MRKRAKKKSTGTWVLVLAILLLLGALYSIGDDFSGALVSLILAGILGYTWYKRYYKKRKSAAPASDNATIFEVAGASYRQGNFVQIGEKARGYDLPDEQFIAKYPEGKRIFKYYFPRPLVELVPEPTNPHDKNAIMVMANGVHIGYVPADLCEELKPRLGKISVSAKIRGGPRKYVSDGIVRVSDSNFGAEITIL